MNTEQHLKALRILKNGIGGRIEKSSRKPPCLCVDIGNSPTVIEWDEIGCYVVTHTESGKTRRYRTPERLLRECRIKL